MNRTSPKASLYISIATCPWKVGREWNVTERMPHVKHSRWIEADSCLSWADTTPQVSHRMESGLKGKKYFSGLVGVPWADRGRLYHCIGLHFSIVYTPTFIQVTICLAWPRECFQGLQSFPRTRWHVDRRGSNHQPCDYRTCSMSSSTWRSN